MPVAPSTIDTTQAGLGEKGVATSTTTAFASYRDNADMILQFLVDEKSLDRDEQLVHVAKTFCPFLILDDNNTDLTVRSLEGGLSNALFVVSSKTTNQSALVRIHPPRDEPSSEDDDKGKVRHEPSSTNDTDLGEIIDRDLENKIMAWLSSENLAPTYYGRFLNGRVEEFYTGCAPISCHDMAKYAPKVAKLMAQLHTRTVPESVISTPTKHGAVWDRIDSWFQMVGSEHQNTPIEQGGESNADSLNLQKLRSEFAWLKGELTEKKNSNGSIDNTKSISDRAVAFCREIVFTHMDCQSLNILTNTAGEVHIIDFEYAGHNARAVDIGNTFCEYCDMNNLKAKYSEEYPSADEQDEFLRAYIQEASPDLAKALDASGGDWEEFLRAVRKEIGRHSLLSHLGWTIWSIVQSRMSHIEFDYIAYAKHRIDGYRYFKSHFWDTGSSL